MKQKWAAIGGVFAMMAVAFGAFGAHGLEGKLTPHLLDVFKTGAYYQMGHALGLIVIGHRAEQRPQSRLLPGCCALLAIGIVVFSGSLYLLAMTGERRWGIVTPFGGISFIAAWALFAVAELTANKAGE